jgi:hypothetical protein
MIHRQPRALPACPNGLPRIHTAQRYFAAQIRALDLGKFGIPQAWFRPPGCLRRQRGLRDADGGKCGRCHDKQAMTVQAIDEGAAPGSVERHVHPTAALRRYVALLLDALRPAAATSRPAGTATDSRGARPPVAPGRSS